MFALYRKLSGSVEQLSEMLLFGSFQCAWRNGYYRQMSYLPCALASVQHGRNRIRLLTEKRGECFFFFNFHFCTSSVMRKLEENCGGQFGACSHAKCS